MLDWKEWSLRPEGGALNQRGSIPVWEHVCLRRAWKRVRWGGGGLLFPSSPPWSPSLSQRFPYPRLVSHSLFTWLRMTWTSDPFASSSGVICWDFRPVPPHLVYTVIGIKHRPLCGSPGWPCPQYSNFDSVSQALELQTCITTHSFMTVLFKVKIQDN